MEKYYNVILLEVNIVQQRKKSVSFLLCGGLHLGNAKYYISVVYFM